MAGIMAAQSAGRNPFGNAMSGISEAAQAAQAAQGAAGNVAEAAQEIQGGELEDRVAALEGQAGSAGGGEVAGVAGMNDGAISRASSMFGDIGNRQRSVGRGYRSSVFG